MRTSFPILVLALAVAGCSRAAPPALVAAPKVEAGTVCPPCAAADLPAAATSVGGDVLAIINGVALTRADVRFALRNRTRNNVPATPEQEAATLEQLIQRELAAQQAVRQGMQADAAVLKDLAEIEVQRSGQRRERLADLYFRRQVLDQTRPSDAEVQALWDREQQQIRTEYHVLQLFGRDEARLVEAQAALQRGQPIGGIYVKLTGAPDLGEARPWDLGFLKYGQTPAQWREVLPRLKAGQTSELIRGPNHRFWVIQVVEVRVNAALQLADVRIMLEEELAAAKRELVRGQIETKLNQTAKIERAPASAIPSPPPAALEP